jgi:hypothetical protein
MAEPVDAAWLVWLETSALAMAMREWRWPREMRGGCAPRQGAVWPCLHDLQ